MTIKLQLAILALALLCVPPARSIEYRPYWNRYSWNRYLRAVFPLEDADVIARRIESNYSGPPLSEIAARSELAEFVLTPDGQVPWIFRPEFLEQDSKVSAKIFAAIKDAIEKSVPIPSCGFQGKATLSLQYLPGQAARLQICDIDHPSQFLAFVNLDIIKNWRKDKWARLNRERVEAHFDLPAHAKGSTAACWLCLTPDGKITGLKSVPVATGKHLDAKAVPTIEKSLKRAIRSARLSYRGAPVAPDQPVGMIVLYRPNQELVVFPHLFNTPPLDVRWKKW